MSIAVLALVPAKALTHTVREGMLVWSWFASCFHMLSPLRYLPSNATLTSFSPALQRRVGNQSIEAKKASLVVPRRFCGMMPPPMAVRTRVPPSRLENLPLSIDGGVVVSAVFSHHEV